MKEIQIAEWVQKIAGDKAPLNDLREWEHRVVAAYSELLDGYKADIDAILNDIARVQDYPGLVLEQGINFTSVCYHHFRPFFGTIDVAYEPGDTITGLGESFSSFRLLPTGFRSKSFWSGTSPRCLRSV
jgi:GTP cyclohydrolase I